MEYNKTTVSRKYDTCDESKCISKGRSEFGSFTCYGQTDNNGDDILYPMMCADGFSPRIVDDEGLFLWKGMSGDDSQVSLQYFTCCPPDHEIDLMPSRRCSDPISAMAFEEDDTTICARSTRKFPRRMRPRGVIKFFDALDSLTDSFICCDFDLPRKSNDKSADDTLNFLDDVECVPYCDEFYKECRLENQIGYLGDRSCNVPEGDFIFPRPIGEATYRWQCCKTGPALPPYVKDTIFKIESFTSIMFFSIGAMASALVAVGLLIPLLMQLKSGTFQTAKSRRCSSYSQRAKRRSSQLHDPSYSTYNLYLAYLAIPDLIYCLFRLGRCVNIINQKDVNSYSVFWATSVSTAAANLWLNAIVCFQVLELLQRSQRGERIDQPSLTRVNLQGLAVLFLATISFLIVYFLWEKAGKASQNGDAEKSQTLINLLFAGWSFLICIPPIVYVAYVNIVVWWRGLMPSRNMMANIRDRRTKGLAVYFLRIVGVFFGVWIPSLSLTFISNLFGTSWTLLAASLFAACQPIATTCMIFFKPDARKHILDLLTLAYSRREGKEFEMGSSNLRGERRTSVSRAFSSTAQLEQQNDYSEPIISSNKESKRVDDIENPGLEDLINRRVEKVFGTDIEVESKADKPDRGGNTPSITVNDEDDSIVGDDNETTRIP